jgi:hypothetical protein
MVTKEDLFNTKWDATEWTEEQRTKFQKKVFELGFSWEIGKIVYRAASPDCYFLYEDGGLTYTTNKPALKKHNHKQNYFEDLFPDQVWHYSTYAKINTALQAGKELHIEGSGYNPFTLVDGRLVDSELNPDTIGSTIVGGAFTGDRRVKFKDPVLTPELKACRLKANAMSAVQFRTGMAVKDLTNVLPTPWSFIPTKDDEDRVEYIELTDGRRVDDTDYVVHFGNKVYAVFTEKDFKEWYEEV